MPRNETLLNPKEKPQEEKNTAQLQLGLRLQPSSSTCLHSGFVYITGQEGRFARVGLPSKSPKTPLTERNVV